GERAVHVAHRDRCDEPREAIGIPPNELRHAVVADPRKLRRILRTGNDLERRRRERQYLLVLVEHIHHAEPLVEIRHHRNVVAPLRDVDDLGDLLESLLKRLRPDVIEDVELTHRAPLLVTWTGIVKDGSKVTTGTLGDEGDTARRLRRTGTNAARRGPGASTRTARGPDPRRCDVRQSAGRDTARRQLSAAARRIRDSRARGDRK